MARNGSSGIQVIPGVLLPLVPWLYSGTSSITATEYNPVARCKNSEIDKLVKLTLPKDTWVEFGITAKR